MTHISTKIAGTFGYLAPEYTMEHKVTRKGDIYSFGVLLLEIVSGRPNMDISSPDEEVLLVKAWNLYEKRKIETLMDASGDEDFNIEEAARFCKVGLLCTQDSPELWPYMSTVLEILMGKKHVNLDNLTKPKTIREYEVDARNRKGKPSSSGTMSFATLTFTAIEDRSN